MQKHVAIVHQAVAEFKAHHFEEAMALLWKAYEHLEVNSLYFTDDSYNAICDSLEMVDALMTKISVLDRNDAVNRLLMDLTKALEGNLELELLVFQKLILAFQELIKGLEIALNFLKEHEMSIYTETPIVSIGFLEAGQIQLYRWEESERVDLLTKAFNAAFEERFLSQAAVEQAIKMALAKGNPKEAQALYVKMIKAFPKSKKEAFLKLGDLHYEEEEYRQAIDCYMKTIVMGTPKESLKEKIQTACNTMARNSENHKEANRWRELLINYFG